MEVWLPLILIVVGVVVMVGIGIYLRRRRAAAGIEESPDLSGATDYTSLPIEEPTSWRDRFNNLSVAGKALIVLVPLLLVVGAVVVVLALSSTSGAEPPLPPPPPAPEITNLVASVVNATTILVRADSTLPPDTPVEVTLLANNDPFPWFDLTKANTKAGAKGEIELRLTKASDAPAASTTVSYTLALKADVNGQTLNPSVALRVPDQYARSFYEQPAPTPVAEVPTATLEPPTATPEPAPPTATPEPQVAALTGSVFNGGNVRDQPVVRGSKVLDQINAGEVVQLLQKTANGQWYLIKNIRNVVGWISATLLNPIAPDVVAQIPAQGTDPLPTAVAIGPTPGPNTGTPVPPPPTGLTASVFNGGNVRDRAQINGSKVLDQINAGETVQLIQKTANGQWYQIKNIREVVGWVNATLLTVEPSVAAKVPVAQ